ncbi:MAG: RRM3/PIF1 helicase-like protein [Deltaproteobacteria bacterium CG11_big_fil_rev_8_21_14_0_20_45_16]|nr:MAG: RRM3/PIF1 helicase-like protein [Deltaproteobacteria bacterium CG11_big_fil_rev_8_21_14_0_20_45_16]
MLNWTVDQSRARNLLDNSKSNLFLTGTPGTGKSALVQDFMATQDRKRVVALGSTGAAAILIGGRTFHSYFALGILQGGKQAAIEKAKGNRQLRSRLRKTDLILIDEVSMLSGEVLDCAETLARFHRESDEPWGGIRIIAVGDFAQLPPVTRSGYAKDWAFRSKAWEFAEFENLEFRQVCRTQEQDFVEILDQIRWAYWSDEVESFLGSHQNDPDEDASHIFPRRYQTESFNRMSLENLEGMMMEFPTRYYGSQIYIEKLQKEAPIPAVLELKEGALVMLRVNDPKQRFVNGSLGKIEVCEPHRVCVKLLDRNRVVEIDKFSFSFINADGEEVAVAENLPLSLAYANTIHKTQGATLDKIHVDLASLWEPGQAYVALSRVRSADGLTIGRWSRDAFQADPEVKAFYHEIRQRPSVLAMGRS